MCLNSGSYWRAILLFSFFCTWDEPVTFCFINLHIVALLGPLDGGLSLLDTVKPPKTYPGSLFRISLEPCAVCNMMVEAVPIKALVRSINQKCCLCSTTFRLCQPSFLVPWGVLTHLSTRIAKVTGQFKSVGHIYFRAGLLCYFLS